MWMWARRVNLDTGQICGWRSNDRPWFEIVQYKWCQKSCNNFFCFLWIYYSVRQKVLFATSPRFHPTNSTNSSKKSSWWNDCSSTRDRKHPGQVSILYQRQAAWSPNFPQRWRSVPHVPLHLYGRQMRILPIGRKNLNPRPKAAEFFLMSNTVFPEFLAPQNGGWLTTVTRNQCCRSRTLPKTTS